MYALPSEARPPGGVPVSGPYVEQTGEPGAKTHRLTEQDARAVCRLFHPPISPSWEEVRETMEWVFDPYLRAAEERGAAKERERIAERLQEARWLGDSFAPHTQAAKIARRGSS